MTLSIELFPAPFGPMMARISCSRTSKLMPVSALTPPKESDTRSSSRTTSPILRCVVTLRGFPRFDCGEDFRFGDDEIGGDDSRSTVLELHLRLDVLHAPAVVERADQHRVLLRDEAAPDLARAGELVVIRVELLVQDQKAMDLRGCERAFAGKLGVHLFDAFADQRVDLRLRRQIGVAGVWDTSALGPVADRSHVDVDERADLVAV